MTDQVSTQSGRGRMIILPVDQGASTGGGSSMSSCANWQVKRKSAISASLR